MKCLSLWQPHATLMAIGAKRNETRKSRMKHRGELAIQAAKLWTLQMEDMCFRPSFMNRLMPLVTEGPEPASINDYDKALKTILPRGVIVCVVTVVDCIEITPQNTPFGDEYEFGNYTPGRFMIKTENPRRLLKPIPYTGNQGVFHVPDELIQKALNEGVVS